VRRWLRDRRELRERMARPWDHPKARERLEQALARVLETSRD
jgi:hypothetical protein